MPSGFQLLVQVEFCNLEVGDPQRNICMCASMRVRVHVCVKIRLGCGQVNTGEL